MALASLLVSILFSFPAEPEKLKFTPPPQPQQCMEFDKEATVPCSATGREKPTVKWVRAGGCRATRARAGEEGQGSAQPAPGIVGKSQK